MSHFRTYATLPPIQANPTTAMFRQRWPTNDGQPTMANPTMANPTMANPPKPTTASGRLQNQRRPIQLPNQRRPTRNPRRGKILRTPYPSSSALSPLYARHTHMPPCSHYCYWYWFTVERCVGTVGTNSWRSNE